MCAYGSCSSRVARLAIAIVDLNLLVFCLEHVTKIRALKCRQATYSLV